MPARASSPVPPLGGWVSYGSRDAVVLAIVLIFLAAAFAYVGTRLRGPISVRGPGRTVSGFMIAIWVLAILTFLVAASAYVVQMRQVHLLVPPPRAGAAWRAGAVRVGTLPDRDDSAVKKGV